MFGRNSVLSKRKRTDQHTAGKGDLRPPAIHPPEQSNKGSPWPVPEQPSAAHHSPMSTLGAWLNRFWLGFDTNWHPSAPFLTTFVPYRTNLAPTDSFCGPSGLLLGFHRVLSNPICSLCIPFGRQAMAKTIKKADGIQWNALEVPSSGKEREKGWSAKGGPNGI